MRRLRTKTYTATVGAKKKEGRRRKVAMLLFIETIAKYVLKGVYYAFSSCSSYFRILHGDCKLHNYLLKVEYKWRSSQFRLIYVPIAATCTNLGSCRQDNDHITHYNYSRKVFPYELAVQKNMARVCDEH